MTPTELAVIANFVFEFCGGLFMLSPGLGDYARASVLGTDAFTFPVVFWFTAILSLGVGLFSLFRSLRRGAPSSTATPLLTTMLTYHVAILIIAGVAAAGLLPAAKISTPDQVMAVAGAGFVHTILLVLTVRGRSYAGASAAAKKKL
jgi:hypothetical protein